MKIKKTSELFWLLGIIFVALGVAICSKADLGVSMIAAPAFVVYEALAPFWSGFSVGMTEYIIQGLMLIIMCIAVRRFNWRYLLAFAVAVLYGYVLNFFLWLLGGVSFDAVWLRWVMLIVGDVITAATFAAGDHIDVTGITKGHGYQGAIKRYGGHIQKMSHGGGPVHRHAGSMGSTSDPSRIFKGHHGAGQMGCDQVTVQNLDVIKVDEELNMIVVRGAIPGPKGGIVYLKNTVKTISEKKGEAGISNNPQKASARVNPQKASARNK